MIAIAENQRGQCFTLLRESESLRGKDGTRLPKDCFQGLLIHCPFTLPGSRMRVKTAQEDFQAG
jgi:hypothetical protein